MSTTVSRFYLHTTDWDGTDPASGDVRKLQETDPGTPGNSTSSCDFGTSGSKEITIDPYTSGRTTTGVNSGFGWAVNLTGADGMGSLADAKRFIKAGVWSFQGRLIASPAPSLAACTVTLYVYRVAASPSTTRTLLFSTAINAGLIGSTNTNWAGSSASQPEYMLEAGETIQITVTLTCTGQVGGLTIAFSTGAVALFNTALFDIPSPGVRTEFIETVEVAGIGTSEATVGTKVIEGIVYDEDGLPASGATVKLFRQSDDVKISQRVSGGAGTYRFTRADDDSDLWYVVGHSDATHHGTTDRDLSAV